MKLRSRILSFSLPLILIPLILISLAIYFFVVRSYEQKERSELAIRISESLAGLNEINKNVNAQLRLLSSAPSLERLLRSESSNEESKAEALRFLRRYRERDPNIREITILDRIGKPVLTSSSGDQGTQPDMSKQVRGFFRSTIVDGRFQAPVFSIGNNQVVSAFAAFIRDDKFLGIAILSYDMKAFAAPLLPRIAEGLSLVGFDDRGEIWLILPGSEVKKEELTEIDWNTVPSFDAAQATKTMSLGGSSHTVSRILIRRSGIDGNYRTSPGDSWFLGIAEPIVPPTGLRSFQIAFGGILLLSTLAVIWLSSITARKITEPIEKVSRATGLIATGTSDLDLVVSGGDEVEDLARSVTKMNYDLQEYQARLVQSARLTAMGEMTSEISHEIQNRISGVSLWLQNLDAEVSEDDDRREYIEEMKMGLAGFIEMLAGLKRFYKKPRLNLSTFEIAGLIAESLDSVTESASEKGITIEKEILLDKGEISADREMLKSVIINLLLNAVEASPGNEIVRVNGKESERSFYISVSDRGAGIPESEWAKVFYPFYTTKASGSGLGLAISKNIVDAHGGTLEISRSDTEGTEFLIRLPKQN